jgi:alkaline phosphatase D
MKHLTALIAAAFSSAASAQIHVLPPNGEVDLITFGSCARQDKEPEVLDDIAAEASDVFLFIGDNTYCDLGGKVPADRAGLKAAWDALAAKDRWRRFAKAQPVLATWDDHDYGKNDAGVEWHLKNDAKDLFLDFFGEPETSERRQRDGIYDAVVVGPIGRRVQIILLDTRYNRSPLTRNPAGRPEGLGPYTASESLGDTILGEAQWAWLEAQLRQPADVRILASSIQIVADEHRYETWGNIPHERDRLYKLIEDTNAHGIIAISGDRHLMELSKDTTRGAPYPFYDFTSSGFNWEDRPHVVNEPNPHRLGDALRQVNYGVIKLNWNGPDTTIELIGKGPQSQVILTETIRLSDLRDTD